MATRSLLSEGKIRYETVEKGEDGQIHSRLIEVEGPTGLITTTTAVSLHPENETRAISVTVNDSSAQTAAILLAQARQSGQIDLSDVSEWVAFQQWLEWSALPVSIPFAEKLASLIPPVAVRLRRDFPNILTLIKTHALLHQTTRPRDAHGRIIATEADYIIVRSLVVDLVGAQVELSVPKAVRETVNAVAAINEATCKPASATELARYLNLDKSAVSRRVTAAKKKGYIVNEETRNGVPYKLVPGEPLPEEPRNTTATPASETQRTAYRRVLHCCTGIRGYAECSGCICRAGGGDGKRTAAA